MKSEDVIKKILEVAVKKMADDSFKKGYAKGIKEEQEKPLYNIIEKVAKDMCEGYCKFIDEFENVENGTELLMEKHCAKCPLNRIL